MISPSLHPSLFLSSVWGGKERRRELRDTVAISGYENVPRHGRSAGRRRRRGRVARQRSRRGCRARMRGIPFILFSHFSSRIMGSFKRLSVKGKGRIAQYPFRNLRWGNEHCGVWNGRVGACKVKRWLRNYPYHERSPNPWAGEGVAAWRVMPIQAYLLCFFIRDRPYFLFRFHCQSSTFHGNFFCK